jgi:DNA gyrase/topoisomerase IV subunit A
VRAIKVDAHDEVIDALTLASDCDEENLAVFTLSGMAKLSPVDQMQPQNRGGKGVRMIVKRGKSPHVCVAISTCSPKDLFRVVDSEGERHELEASRIPITRRDGNAWTVVTLKGGATVALVEHEPHEEPVSEDAGEPSDAEAEISAAGTEDDTLQDIPAAPSPEEQA